MRVEVDRITAVKLSHTQFIRRCIAVSKENRILLSLRIIGAPLSKFSCIIERSGINTGTLSNYTLKFLIESTWAGSIIGNAPPWHGEEYEFESR